MEYGGMVHALEEIHRLLKSSGTLIDIHPVAESSRIEVHQGGQEQQPKIDLVGYLSVRQWCTDFQQADKALAEIAQRGLFAVEREDVFDSLIYYDSAAEMRTDLKEAIDYFDRGAESTTEEEEQVNILAARAEALMQDAVSGAELIAHEPTHISRLRPT
jgi:hypothetical protein